MTKRRGLLGFLILISLFFFFTGLGNLHVEGQQADDSSEGGEMVKPVASSLDAYPGPDPTPIPPNPDEKCHIPYPAPGEVLECFAYFPVQLNEYIPFPPP